MDWTMDWNLDWILDPRACSVKTKKKEVCSLQWELPALLLMLEVVSC